MFGHFGSMLGHKNNAKQIITNITNIIDIINNIIVTIIVVVVGSSQGYVRASLVPAAMLGPSSG